MNISIAEAKAKLTKLVAAAEAGNRVIITRHGKPVAELSSVVKTVPTPEERKAAIKTAQNIARQSLANGPDAAYATDWLYDENGLPI